MEKSRSEGQYELAHVPLIPLNNHCIHLSCMSLSLTPLTPVTAIYGRNRYERSSINFVSEVRTYSKSTSPNYVGSLVNQIYVFFTVIRATLCLDSWRTIWTTLITSLATLSRRAANGKLDRSGYSTIF